MNKLSLRDVTLTGKRVFVRADLNVPLDEQGNITDDTRICASLPTIKYCLEQGASIVLASHLGRPKGTVVPALSLKPVADRLSRLLEKNILFPGEIVGSKVSDAAKCLKQGDILLLENLRFHPGETKNDPELSRELAALADIYVNDAFGTAHRAHSSTAGITSFLKPAVCGFLLEKEINYLGKTLGNPTRPFVAILGGAKISGKIDVIRNLLPRVDTLLIGGGMAYTFFRAMGLSTGDSLLEEDRVQMAGELLETAERDGAKLLLPIDCVIADSFSESAKTRIVRRDEIPDGWQSLDIGPETRRLFSEKIREAKTIVWNGPMGVFEFDAFAEGTTQIARAVAESGAVSIVGGGDSVAAIRKAGFTDKITHISTGGGASIEFLEGKTLPGLDALDDR